VTGRDETERPGRGVVARLDAEAFDEVGATVRFDYEGPFRNVTEGVAVRLERGVVAFRNVCPHLGLALDCHSNAFTDADEGQFECDAHGARFEIDSGRCTDGPCEGERLKIFEVELDEAAGEYVIRSEGRGLSV
jgi:nitrite reductase/ring-hydroxylating ferredoxin subunit